MNALDHISKHQPLTVKLGNDVFGYCTWCKSILLGPCDEATSATCPNRLTEEAEAKKP
jgi:hypothetical protein